MERVYVDLSLANIITIGLISLAAGWLGVFIASAVRGFPDPSTGN